jgi:hypothetical protein
MMAIRVTPVPIPNTTVKPYCADGTAGEALWKSRLLPGQCSEIAQSVEHSAVNRSVQGSSPCLGAILFEIEDYRNVVFFVFFVNQ